MAEKFQFDAVFIIDDKDGQVAARPPRMKYKAEEVEEIRAAAFEEGKQAVQAASGQLIEVMAGELQRFVSRLDSEVIAAREDATRLAVATADKLSFGALEQFSRDVIARGVEAGLSVLRSEPHLEVQVPANAPEDVCEQIKAAADRMGFADRLSIGPAQGLGAADFKIVWSNGELHSDRAALLAEVEQRVENFLLTLADDHAQAGNGEQA